MLLVWECRGETFSSIRGWSNELKNETIVRITSRAQDSATFTCLSIVRKFSPIQAYYASWLSMKVIKGAYYGVSRSLRGGYKCIACIKAPLTSMISAFTFKNVRY